ncbi:MAG: hypothetical protein SGPRY_009368 [Prymnesium sp.]
MRRRACTAEGLCCAFRPPTLNSSQALALREAEEAVTRTRRERRDRLVPMHLSPSPRLLPQPSSSQRRPGNPRVFLDIEITRKATAPVSSLPQKGRIEFILYAHEAPRAAENFRAMCTGEKGGKLTYKGMRFYRILDMFIDQAPKPFACTHPPGALS